MLKTVLDKVQTTLGYTPTGQDSDWVDTRTATTEVIALTEAKNILDKTDFLEQKNLRKNIDLLLKIDEEHYQTIKKITHKYLIDINKNRDVQNDSESVLYEHSRTLYKAYTQVFEVYQNQIQLKLTLGHINLILARLLNAAFMMVKYRYFNDQPAPVGTWEHVYEVIKIAENLTLMNKNLFLYKFQIKETSIATLLKRGFMLSTLQKGSYSKLQIEITDRVLKIWASNPLIVSTYKQGRYQFGIKLASDAGPDRVRMVEKFEEYRFWRTTRLLDLMESYLCAANTDKELKEFGLDDVAPATVIVKLFKKLRVEWCVEGYSRQRRQEKRNAERKLLNLSHGVDGISQRLASLQSGSAKNITQDPRVSFEVSLANKEQGSVALALSSVKTINTESYWTVDESRNGFAIDFGSDLDSWIDTGVLVGYNTAEDESEFGIAEIRSVRKLASGVYRAGFKIISKNTKAIDVLTTINNQGLQNVSNYFVDGADASLVKARKFLGMFILNEGKDDIPTLVIPRAEYQRDRKYTININAVDHKLKPGRVVSKQRDWICFEALF